MSHQVIAAAKVDRKEDLQNKARAIALLSEGLIVPHELIALANICEEEIPILLLSPPLLAEVRRTIMQLRVSGEAARLEATQHAREAVKVAAKIMRDPEMHASNRLNAATFISRVSGTERPRADAELQETHTITINIGGETPPIIVKSEYPYNHPNITREDT